MEFETVQSIASLSKHASNTIPPEFIRSKDEQPSSTTQHGVNLEVPTIDLSSEGDDEEERIVHSLSEASEEWGLFQVVNHGISDELISELQRVGKEFFDLPEDEKESIAKTRDSGVEGYGTKLQKEVEGRRGWVDHLFHKVWPPSIVDLRFWPKNPPSYRKVNEEYAVKLKEFSDKLLRWLSLGLGLEGEELKVALGSEDLIFLLKINFYPPCPRPDLALGVVAHTDMSAITILVPNEVQGLQVFRKGHWYDVKYIPNALIIHIGDQMEILSNGRYKAVLHRSTVNKGKTRMSWPVFLEPPPEHVIGPHPRLVSEESPSKFKAKMYKDYAYCKLNKLPQ